MRTARREDPASSTSVVELVSSSTRAGARRTYRTRPGCTATPASAREGGAEWGADPRPRASTSEQSRALEHLAVIRERLARTRARDELVESAQLGGAPSKMKRAHRGTRPNETRRDERTASGGKKDRIPRRAGRVRVARGVVSPVPEPSNVEHADYLGVERALPGDVPGGEETREFALDGVDDGVVDPVTLEEVGRLVAGHLGGTGVEGGAHHVLHGSVQGGLRGSGGVRASGEKRRVCRRVR